MERTGLGLPLMRLSPKILEKPWGEAREDVVSKGHGLEPTHPLRLRAGNAPRFEPYPELM